MMSATTYRTPGVYVEWLDANRQQIQLRRTDVAGFVGLAERGPVQEPVKIESDRQFLSTFGERLRDGYLGHAVGGFFDNGGRTCWIVRAANPVTAACARIRLVIAGHESFVLEATSPGAWGNGVVVEAIWGRDRITRLDVRAGDRSQSLSIDDGIAGAAPARVPPVRTNLLGVNDAGLPQLAPAPLVRRLADDPSLAALELTARAPEATLAGGADGAEGLTLSHLTGNPDRDGEWGVASLEGIDGISFVAVPDLMAGQDPQAESVGFSGFVLDQVADAQIAIARSCARCRDRVAILDLPPAIHEQVVHHKDLLAPTSFAAVYHPWIVVDDPSSLRGIRRMPPSGHVAGLYARCDRSRGVHKPPANEVLEGVFDVRELLDDAEHGDLNEAGVNVIRAIPGRGLLVLGARTLDPDVRWRYVNVRRLFAMIEEAIEEQMQWLTFEPSNPRLWRDVDRAVRTFLERLYRAGMLDGATAEHAYAVRCDESTNPSVDTSEGRLQCDVGIQPPYPAEFVVVRIGVTRSGIQIEEKGAQDV